MRKTNSKTLGMSRIDTRYAHSASGAAAVLLQGKWRVEILCAMRSGPVRVGQLSRLIPGASKKMLAQNLRRLEVDRGGSEFIGRIGAFRVGVLDGFRK